MLKLYTDASILNSKSSSIKGICGLGVVILDRVGKQDKRILDSFYTSQHKDDINIGEMLAILKGLEIVEQILPKIERRKKPKISVITDSSSCVNYLNGKVPGESNREFTKQQKEKHILLRSLCYKVKSYSKYYDLTFSHIKGHTRYLQEDSINNTLADVMARDGLRKYLDENVRDSSNKRNKSKINFGNKFSKDGR